MRMAEAFAFCAVFAFLVNVQLPRSTMMTSPTILFFGGLQQSRGSERIRRVCFAFFSFDTMALPNLAPTPTNSASSTPLTQVCTFTRTNWFAQPGFLGVESSS
ncbi:hypothetical protein V8G54_014601 [Vigna mungo]|uniref:Secreted protein n=1 Tax=Vigna mungo TaxID=3915 RepID=A0AAQ3NJD6_VIGMU